MIVIRTSKPNDVRDQMMTEITSKLALYPVLFLGTSNYLLRRCIVVLKIRFIFPFGIKP